MNWIYKSKYFHKIGRITESHFHKGFAFSLYVLVMHNPCWNQCIRGILSCVGALNQLLPKEVIAKGRLLSYGLTGLMMAVMF